MTRVAMINVPTSVGRDAWEKCFRRTAARAPIFGVNEVFAPAMKALFRELADEYGLGRAGLSSGPNPIFWDRSLYRYKSSRLVKLHGAAKGAKARRYPGFNAARYATVVILEPRDGGPEVCIINWHRTARGDKVDPAWRLWAWARSNAKVRAIIRRQRKAGRITWVIGDTNQSAPFKLAGIFWLRPNGVDKIGVALPPGVRLGRRGAWRYEAPTDHGGGVVAVARFRRP